MQILLLGLAMLGTSAHALDLAILDLLPPCTLEYARFSQQLEQQQRREELRWAIGALSENRYSSQVGQRLKSHWVQKILEHETVRQVWAKSLKVAGISVKENADFKVEEFVEFSGELIYESMVDYAKDEVFQEFKNVFLREVLSVDLIRKEFTQPGILTGLAFSEVKAGVWRTPLLKASRWLESFWAMITIPLSASRVPPEGQWANLVEDHPSLLLNPVRMKRMNILQEGENFRDVYCAAFLRHPRAMRQSVDQLIAGMERAFQNEVLDVLYPERTEVNPQGIDALYVKPSAIQYVVPNWANIRK